MPGLGRMVCARKDAIGAVISRREGLLAETRVLVGLRPVDAAGAVVAGANLFAEGAAQNTGTDQGWITSACFSPHLGSAIGLGLLERSAARLDEVNIAANPLQGETMRLRVFSPQLIDSDGGRLRD